MNKQFFVALFTVAVLLGGTTSYAASMYMLPVADASHLDAGCAGLCADNLLGDIDMCVEEYGNSLQDDLAVTALITCAEQANQAFIQCQQVCGNIAPAPAPAGDDDDDDDDEFFLNTYYNLESLSTKSRF